MDDPAHASDERPTPAETLVGATDPRRPISAARGVLSDDPWIGRTLGGLYHIEEPIGVGGMGAVYLASHRRLGKTFALKVVTDPSAAGGKAAERLLAEARAASRIDHPNVVRVVNCDLSEEGLPFVVMELLEGRDLGALLAERGALGVAEAVAIARQVAEGLAAAHALDLIHRDVKPENVLVIAPGLEGDPERIRVKVLDFGISKSIGEGSDPALTADGQVVGTPLYLSPEQARGEPVLSPAVDQYALGALLFEMLAGFPPYQGSLVQLLYKHGNAPIPELPVREDDPIPAEVASIVRRALQKAPEERFESMEAMAEALFRCASTKSGAPAETASEPSKVRSGRMGSDGSARRSASRLPEARRWLLLATGLLALALSGVALYPPFAERSETREKPPRPREAPAPEGEPSGATKAAPASSAGEGRGAVHWALTSRPPGAVVTVDGEPRGRTPLGVELPRAGEPRSVRFSLEGRVPVVRTLTPVDDGELFVTLRRRPRVEAARSSPLPIKTRY